MTAPQLLEKCQARGIALWREDLPGAVPRLGFELPAEIDDDRAARLLETLRRLKPELLELLDSRPVEASPRRTGGQITPPIAQTGLLAPPDAKQGVPAGVEGWDEAPEVAASMRRRIRAAVDQARSGAFPELGPVELEAGRTVDDPAAWLLLAVERLKRAVDALQQTRFGTSAYARRWQIAAEIVADMETVADRVDQAKGGP